MTSVSHFGRYVLLDQKMFGLRMATRINLSKDKTDCYKSCQFDGTSRKIIINDQQGLLLRVSLDQRTYNVVNRCIITHIAQYNEKNDRLIAVEWCKGESRLVFINHSSKKEDLLAHLNMGRLLSFSVNLIRDIVLALDSGLLQLFDIKLRREWKSKKAKNQKFVAAQFTSDNKSVLLLNNQMKLSVLNISDLNEKWSIVLPTHFDDAKIHTSYDSKWVIVSGNSKLMYLVELHPDKAPDESRLELHTQIKSGRFLINGDFVFVGRDQIFYVFSLSRNPDRIYRLFNYERQKPINCFDVSQDMRYLAAVTNDGSLLLFDYNSFSQDKFVQIFWINDQPTNQVDYDPLNKSFEVEKPEEPRPLSQKSTHNQFQDFQMIPQLEHPQDYSQEEESIDIDPNIENRAILENSYRQLKKILNRQYFFDDFKHEVIQLLYAFHLMFQPRKANSVAGFFISWLTKIRQRIPELVVVLTPNIKAYFSRIMDMDLAEFVADATNSLYLDYFNKQEWLRIVKFLLGNRDKDTLPVVFILMLLRQLWPKIQKISEEKDFMDIMMMEKDIDIGQLMDKCIDLYDDPKMRLVLQNQPQEQVLVREVERGLHERLAEYTQQSDEPNIGQDVGASEYQPINRVQDRLDELWRKNHLLMANISTIEGQKEALLNTFN